MSLTPKFCSQCAGPVEERHIEERLRIICTICGAIFYKNPLPIAAAVVLNDRREVLLVKRKNEPKKGLWCLPIGFAEIGETIGHAAVRELSEEAGIYGTIVRLVDASSMVMDIYGDVLVVTFEIEKSGGDECAGDDAEMVGYFAPDDLPTLAFPPNFQAIKNCFKEHSSEWAIQDSFHRLEKDDHRHLLSDSLVSFIKDHATILTELWYDEVCGNPVTSSFSQVQTKYLKNRTMTVLTHFSDWLMDPGHHDEMMVFYRKLGVERRYMGFGIHEVLSAMNILRRIVVSYTRKHMIRDRAIDAYMALEFDHRIIHFFDEALYHEIRGYMED